MASCGDIALLPEEMVRISEMMNSHGHCPRYHTMSEYFQRFGEMRTVSVIVWQHAAAYSQYQIIAAMN